MPSKRRNNGRSKKNKGHANVVRCINCGRIVAKDKAIKRFQMRQMVDLSSRRDIKDNYAYDPSNFNLPKIYVKLAYCVSCAIHARVVRVRSSKARAGGKGERFKRYTTKLRNVKNIEAITGTAAVPLGDPSKFKKFLNSGNRDGDRKPARD